jgi:hypothetical protein
MPLGKLREILDDTLGIRVEDVGAILMDQHAGVVVPIICVATDVTPPVDHEHSLIAYICEALRKH